MKPDAFTPLADCTFAAIDFESAGTAPGQTDHPIQVGIAKWSLTGGWQETWVSYIACQADITWSAQKVHGITLKDLKSAPSFASLWPELKSRLEGCVCVGHNIGTELKFLSHFPGHDFGPWIDTLQLCREAFPNAPKHALGNLCQWLSLEKNIETVVPNKHWHDALYDAAASIALLEELVRRFELQHGQVGLLLEPDTRAYHQSRRK